MNNIKEIVSLRIKSARTIAGLSLRELSQKINGVVSHTAITKYESGLIMPDSKVLLALSSALNVKVDYFLRPYNINIDNIEFRKKSKLPVKTVKGIKEEVTDMIARYIELEQFLNLSSDFINPLQNVVINSGNDIENAVNSLLIEWRIGFNALPNVIELLEDKEIKVIELDVNEHFDGLSGWANSNIPVIVVNKNFPIERKRFTALHELAHLLLRFNNNIDPKMIEKYCHRFAGAMLIPKDTFFTEIGKNRNNISISELINVKETYGISIQAIMARAKDLGVISEDKFIQYRIWVNKSENHKKEIGMGEFIGKEHSSRFKQLLYRATAEEVISMSKAANLANQKLASFRDEFIAI